MNSYCICYNLYRHQFSEIPLLPEALIVSNTEIGLGYIQKQAIPNTLKSFEISIEDSPHQELLDICAMLRPNALAQRFVIKKGKSIDLLRLLQDQQTKKVILSFISKKLATFYALIRTHEYPITYLAQKKDPIQGARLAITYKLLEPKLAFTKTAVGIEYAFTLDTENKTIIPKEHEIAILLNEPSWIILDQTLFQINHLNANKLKPFFNKEKITIPKKHINTYLEKVIIPVLKNVNVTAKGFKINTHQTITAYCLEIIHDFTQQKYIAKVSFSYTNVIFDYHSPKTTSSTIVYENEDQIEIIQTKRNPKAEEEIINLLITKGLQLTPSLMLEKVATEDPFEIFEWLITYQDQLRNEKFAIKLPQLNTKSIDLSPHQITIQNRQENDWFDLHGTVTIGSKKIPFSKFVPYIKRNDRLFPLGKQRVFIIPLEWMSRYKKLANFGKVKDYSILLNKNNYTLLKEIVSSEEILPENTVNTTYTPSTRLKATLRPYQIAGVQWLVQHYNNQLGACLADDMGLGKTLQTIAMLIYAKEQIEQVSSETHTIELDLFSDPLAVKTCLKALIVLPSSLIFNWAQEILKFAPHFSVVKYVGSDRKKISVYLESYDIVLTTYALVSRDISILKKINFTYLIIDESQQIKNKDSKIFQYINEINAVHKISLSGTPIENSLSDLWSQMQFINPGILGSFSFFKEHFKIPIEKHQNEERTKELKTLIEPFILRRTKEQVAKDLPKLSEQIVYTKMLPEQAKLYEAEKSAARNLLLGLDNVGTNKIKIINTLTKLRQLANHPKLITPDTANHSGKFEDVTFYLETLLKSNKKVLLFSSFVSHLKLYEQWCTTKKVNFVSLTGQTKSIDREQIVNRFQEDDTIPLFFISLKAGGVGLNLTKASYVILLDPWWNPFVEKQAIARSHRIGQTHPVTVTRFISKNTIEEKIIQLQEKKQDLSDEIIDINKMPKYIEKDLTTLLG
ncbi:ATP-dependent helicase [Aquimarina sp. U1-2]|uniref:DEAD/DEAH box helicase n=1 Tax=Aquimarina sp. U1-2 TaxID=2823141 RepID=UPI001AEC7692|nr:DEAD/DEAH box helicase [Aquimarina sp. U1-2]MBP2832425.1 ATP-dependent helicase [Aquimarina sp. U1-2]